MSATIPTKEPETITAGDTVKWTKSLTDYPASTWTLTYTAVAGNAANENFTVTATASGSGHAVTITAATSVGYLPGLYRLFGHVSDGTDRYQVYDGWLEVKDDPTLTLKGTDFRSHWRKVKEALEPVIQGKASQSTISYSVGGRNFNRMSWTELLEIYNTACARVALEEEQAAADRGETGGRIIGIRFTRP